MGNLGVALFYHAIGAYLIYFYVDVVRLDPALVGLAVSTAYGIWNAVNDPLVGYLSDRTKSRWGRRIPYIMFGTPLAALLFALVWTPPAPEPLGESYDLAMLAYLAVVLALFDLAYTAVSVPYISLFPEMFEDLAERAEVSAYRQVSAMAGCILAFALTPILASQFSNWLGRVRGWSITGAVLGLIGCAALLTSLLGSRERREFWSEPQPPLLKAFKTTFSNRTFLAFEAANLMICYVWSWLSAMVPFIAKYALGVSEGEVSILFLAMFLSCAALYPLWRRYAVRHGSKETLVISTTLFVLLLSPFLVVRELWQAVLVMLALGAANSGITLVREVVLSDVIDEDELMTGARREGMYFGVNAFIERFSMVLVGASSASVFKLSGYSPVLKRQPPTVELGVRLSVVLLPLVALVVFLLAMRFYPLTRDKVVELRRRLNELHERKARRLAGEVLLNDFEA